MDPHDEIILLAYSYFSIYIKLRLVREARPCKLNLFQTGRWTRMKSFFWHIHNFQCYIKLRLVREARPFNTDRHPRSIE